MNSARHLPAREHAMRMLVVPTLIVLLAACTPFRHGVPGTATSVGPGAAMLRIAESQIGVPYRYGGEGPDAFDCSGLVAYVHRQVGLTVPRTAARQFAAVTPVGRGELQPGDLVFFRLDGRDVSHVGIYAGDERFVHAPQRGGKVRMASLAEETFRRSWAGAGRFYAPD
jgi:cell wall-associated NlpC family hydrolase